MLELELRASTTVWRWESSVVIVMWPLTWRMQICQALGSNLHLTVPIHRVIDLPSYETVSPPLLSEVCCSIERLKERLMRRTEVGLLAESRFIDSPGLHRSQIFRDF